MCQQKDHKQAKNIEAKWGTGKAQMFTLKEGRGGGIYFLNETSACVMNAWLNTYFRLVSSRYVFSYDICFRIIHFILISTVHELLLTCLPVSISGT